MNRYWLLAAALAAAALSALVVRRRFAVVTVTGHSMLPTLRDGDRVLVRRVPLGQVRTGDVVVVEWPVDDSGPAQQLAGVLRRRRWMIKRAAAVPCDPVPDAFRAHWPVLAGDRVPVGNLVLLGDNLAGSYDSRRLGYISGDRLLGVVARTMADAHQDVRTAS